MIKSKSVVKKLTTILFTLVAVFAVGLTNVSKVIFFARII